MLRWSLALPAAVLLVLAVPPAWAAQPPVGVVQNFGPNLKATCPNPEGIAVDPTGNLYAASFAFAPVANVCVVSPDQRVVDVIPIPAGPAGDAALLGELFEPSQGLYAVDFANGTAPNGRLLRIDPATHAITILATGFQAANAIAQDRHRDLFVSDSFAGTITKVAPDGSSSQVWASSSLLTTKGFPPFGANGVAFDRNERFLYVANTGDSRVLRIPVEADGSAGPIEVFAQGSATTQVLHGADGVMFDVRGNLYVCANQANEVQVLDPSAHLIARYKGTGANAFDFPASLVFHERALYVTNLSLSDSGVNSKLSVLGVPFPGLPLRP
ncbi:MAG TPA: SMP-30/gluconolactonase/LRE family protein [Candidatus Dormibacteraeota bacterium]|nr:SMP-30/gluconolactonase/LRE family protein [Candidatus Dormibacteraeota bacterium]